MLECSSESAAGCVVFDVEDPAAAVSCYLFYLRKRGVWILLCVFASKVSCGLVSAASDPGESGADYAAGSC